MYAQLAILFTLVSKRLLIRVVVLIALISVLLGQAKSKLLADLKFKKPN
jgi:hypothetical protein